MVKIQFDIPEKLNKELNIYIAQQDLKTKADAIIQICEERFVKLKQVFTFDEDLQGENIMGMYTHVRGWISLDGLEMTTDEYNSIISKAEDISPRSSQCITCTVFNLGFNFENYIFIGGEIKNYDNDWDTYLNFIFDNFDISNYKLEMKYEEDDEWTQITKANIKGDN